MDEEKWVFIIDDTDNSASQSSYSSEKERLENIEDLKKIRKSLLESCTKKWRDEEILLILKVVDKYV